MTEITRRRLLASASAGAAGLGLGGATGFLVGRDSAAEASDEGTGTVPFYGEHQAGIDTPAQDRLHFAAFDLVTESRSELRELLREWSLAASEMAEGQLIGDVNSEQLAPPDDTGETVGLLPSDLSITFGFGPSMFERRGLGLAGKRPAALRGLPPLPGDELSRAKAAATSASRPAPTIPRSSSRDPQPRQDRPRRRRHEVVAARIRPHLEHQPQPGDAAQPDGDEGRNRQHPG